MFEGLHSGHNTDGKFGPAQLSSSLLAIDFDQSKIRLLSELPTDLSQWQELSFETSHGAIFIATTVGSGDKSVEHKFMIHSGYSGFALLDDSFTSAHPFLAKLEIIDESELTDSSGSKIKTRRVALRCPVSRLARPFSKIHPFHFSPDLLVDSELACWAATS